MAHSPRARSSRSSEKKEKKKKNTLQRVWRPFLFTARLTPKNNIYSSPFPPRYFFDVLPVHTRSISRARARSSRARQPAPLSVSELLSDFRDLSVAMRGSREEFGSVVLRGPGGRDLEDVENTAAVDTLLLLRGRAGRASRPPFRRARTTRVALVARTPTWLLLLTARLDK